MVDVQTKFVGTVTDKSFIKALSEQKLTLEEKKKIYWDTKDSPMSWIQCMTIVGYQNKRFYFDEVENE